MLSFGWLGTTGTCTLNNIQIFCLFYFIFIFSLYQVNSYNFVLQGKLFHLYVLRCFYKTNILFVALFLQDILKNMLFGF
jgi:hypothetical protein